MVEGAGHIWEQDGKAEARWKHSFLGKWWAFAPGTVRQGLTFLTQLV